MTVTQVISFVGRILTRKLNFIYFTVQNNQHNNIFSCCVFLKVNTFRCSGLIGELWSGCNVQTRCNNRLQSIRLPPVRPPVPVFLCVCYRAVHSRNFIVNWGRGIIWLYCISDFRNNFYVICPCWRLWNAPWASLPISYEILIQKHFLKHYSWTSLISSLTLVLHFHCDFHRCLSHYQNM